MKITFDGITIEDADTKEAVEMLRALRGKGVSSAQPKMFKLPKEVRAAGDAEAKEPKAKKNPNLDAWTREQISMVLQTLDKAPLEATKQFPELKSKCDNSAMYGMRSKIRIAIKTGRRPKGLNNMAWALLKELGMVTISEEAPEQKTNRQGDLISILEKE